MAKFNYDTKCAHPAKCSHLMKKFLQDACDLTFEIKNFYLANIGGDLKIEDVKEGETISVDKTVLIRKGTHGFRAFVNCREDLVEIEYDFKTEMRNPEAVAEFRRNAVLRNPAMQGFSGLTLSLLHELGHFETADDVPEDYDRFEAQAKMRKYAKDDIRKLNMMYFSLPDEWLATQWAIDWLSDEDNRKRAKQFERDFFAAWRGE